MISQRILASLILLVVFLSACGPAQTPVVAPPVEPVKTQVQPTQLPSATPVPATPQAVGAFESGQYRNAFKDTLGKSDADIQAKLDAAWEQLFYGDDNSQRVYYPVGDDMAYVKDIGNSDIRSEGMSYGMMIAVQLNKQEEFNRIWKWTKTYMYQADGPYAGYFAWHCKEDGTQLDANPASDGEEWFVMALMFASGRWGNGDGIFNYRAEADGILNTMLHKEESNPDVVTNMFNLKEKQVVFVPRLGSNSFSDPSYHLPAYYELWARWASQDQDFWKSAAQTSRGFFKKAANPQTGLMPDYADFDGKAHGTDDHKDFRYDAYRAGANVAVDYLWFAADPWQIEQSNRMLDFFASQGIDSYVNLYSLDGKPLSGDRSTGLIAMNAVAAMVATTENRKAFIQALWDAPIPSGQWRYYDGLLYELGLLHLSGNFRIYPPQAGQAASAGNVPTKPAKLTRSALGTHLVPPDGRALLMIGQDVDSVQAFFDATYKGPGGVSGLTSLNGLEGLTQKANTSSGPQSIADLAKSFPNSTLVVGVSLGDQVEAVSQGALDKNIDKLLAALESYPRPVYLRFGYGFDHPAKPADPEAYKAAWLYFRQKLQAKGLKDVAMVWQSSAACAGSAPAPALDAWYPGDEAVDWVGLAYFNQADCPDKPLEAVVEFARQHAKPVLIAEAAPQGYDLTKLTYSADGKTFEPRTADQIWEGWFKPFFEFVHTNSDVIRGVIYINADWNAQSLWGKPYKNGYRGDSRVQANPDIFKLWKTEAGQKLWMFANVSLFDQLK